MHPFFDVVCPIPALLVSLSVASNCALGDEFCYVGGPRDVVRPFQLASSYCRQETLALCRPMFYF